MIKYVMLSQNKEIIQSTLWKVKRTKFKKINIHKTLRKSPVDFKLNDSCK